MKKSILIFLMGFFFVLIGKGTVQAGDKNSIDTSLSTIGRYEASCGNYSLKKCQSFKDSPCAKNGEVCRNFGNLCLEKNPSECRAAAIHNNKFALSQVLDQWFQDYNNVCSGHSTVGHKPVTVSRASEVSYDYCNRMGYCARARQSCDRYVGICGMTQKPSDCANVIQQQMFPPSENIEAVLFQK